MSLFRPETVESLWILHEITGDPKYREWGHRIFLAFEKHCKSRYGYGAHPDVTEPSMKCCRGNDDKQESFWLAETLKYLYLLMDPQQSMSLNDFTFTTEAHPLRVANHRTSR